MKCHDCGKEPEMIWKDAEHKNGRSETFYTRHSDGKIVCRDCLGQPVKSLQDIQDERQAAEFVGGIKSLLKQIVKH